MSRPPTTAPPPAPVDAPVREPLRSGSLNADLRVLPIVEVQ